MQSVTKGHKKTRSMKHHKEIQQKAGTYDVKLLSK